MKKQFTLIELIVVIAVLGILASIIFPNFGDVRQKAYVSQVKTNMKSIETVSTAYKMDYGKYPTTIQPTIGSPQIIDFDLLGTELLKSRPTGKETYWIDFSGQVWASTVDIPKIQEDEKLSWLVDENVKSYELFEVKSTKVSEITSSVQPNYLITKLMKKDVDSGIKVMEFFKEPDTNYLISAYDQYGFQTPPANKFSNPVTLGENETSRTFYIDTYAETIAEWVSVYAIEYIPEGARIDYEFATSNDGFETISDYTSDFSTVEDSNGIRVKVTLTRTKGKPAPILEYLEVYFKTGGVEDGQLGYCRLNPLKSKQICQTTGIHGTISKPQVIESSSSHVDFKVEEGRYFVDSINSSSQSYSSTKICYRNSKNRTNWSECVISGTQLENQETNHYVRVETTDVYNPIIITTDSNISNSTQNIENDSEYIIYDKFTLVESSEQPVEWLSVDIEQTKENSENAFIDVDYAYGDNVFSSFSKEFKAGHKSKKLRISTVSKAKRDVDESDYPYIEKITVKYKKQDGSIEVKEYQLSESLFYGPENLYDKDYDTYAVLKDMPENRIELNAGVENRMLVFTVENLALRESFIYFLDEQNKVINFINANSNEIVESYAFSKTKGKHQVKLIIPENAKYIWFKTTSDSSSDTKFYEIEGTGSRFAKGLKNITYTPDKHSMSFKWDNQQDADLEKTIVYRNGVCVGETKTNSFISKSLVSNTEYDYEFHTVSKNGNRTVTKAKAKTMTSTILWHGFAPELFDGDLDTFNMFTYYNGPKKQITWDGDLSGQVISITGSAVSGWNYKYYVYVLDSNNNKLLVANAETNQVSPSIAIPVNEKGTVKFIMPENAVKLVLEAPTSSFYISIYDVSENEDLSKVKTVTNITTTPMKNKITLNWTNPIDENFEKVVVYRDGVYVGETTGTTITDKSLLADTEYHYEVFSVHKNGNRTVATTTAKTILPEILWHGFSPYLFDDDLETFTSFQYFSSAAKVLTWDGDLSNRVISLTGNAVNSTNYKYTVYVLDSSGKKLKVVDADTNQVCDGIVIPINNKGTVRFIMPENAVKLSFSGATSGSINIYDVSHGSELTTTNPVNNITYLSTANKITLNWTNPTDENFEKVVVYRDGVYVGETTGTAITDKSLYADTEYHYEVFSVHKNGNRTVARTMAKTIRPDVLWHGFSPYLFDEDLDTFDSFTYYNGPNKEITWEGNLSGKVISITGSATSSWKYKYGVYLLDENNKKLEILNPETNELMPCAYLPINTKGTVKFIMPENAVKLVLYAPTSGLTISIHEIEYN